MSLSPQYIYLLISDLYDGFYYNIDLMYEMNLVINLKFIKTLFLCQLNYCLKIITKI